VKSRTIEHCAAIGFERKNSLKDDLPDLTPYLSKKGGNSQGKAADNSAGKTDISSKLSALVKKSGTLSGSDADAIVDSQSSVIEKIEQPVVGSSDNASTAQSGSNAAVNSSGWEQVDSFSSASSMVSAARLEAQAEALAQEKMFAQAAAGASAEPSAEPAYAPSSSDFAAANQPTPPAVAEPAAGSNNDDSVSNSQSGSFSTSGNFSTSGTFATRPVASRPGGPAPSMDKFKAPQARPMNTLSSGAPPLLKAPEKEAVRTPAPYTFQQANEAPREAVVPKSMQLPTPAPPTSSAPGSSAQALRAAEIAKDPPPSWPAQPTAPPRIVEKIEKAERRVESQPQPQPQPQYQPQQYQPQPQPNVRQQAQPESTSEILAKAFIEEAKALEQNSDDMLEPPSASVQSNFSSESDSQYESPYFEPKPKGTVGFGSLLNAGSTAPDFGAHPEPEEHSSLADLMIPTGEHQALFAPERRGDGGISPFDEVQPSGLSDSRQDNYGDNSTSFADVGGLPEAAIPNAVNPNAVLNESVRVDEKAAAPAFSSLFSTEIVTSGQDYSFSDYKPSALDSDIEKAHDQVALSPEETAAQSSGVLSQSDAISKLLEAVNKEQNNANPNLVNNFAEQPFTEGNYSEPDDMRTADTMFGSGGSNKGSAEELSAADAVFGAVPDLVAPLPESSPPFNSSPTSAGFSSGFGSSPSSSPSSSSASSFPEQPVLGKDSLPIAFANAENFEQESLESIKLGIRKAKAEEKARKKAEEEAKLAEANFEEARAAEAASAAPEVVARAETSRENLAEPIKPSEQQSPKSTAKLSLTEMIELANSAKLEQVQEGRPTQAQEQPTPAPAQAGLSSLLSAASYEQPVSKVADDEDDDGDSLGGAISDALDKLLSAGQEEQSPPFAAKINDSTSFSDEPSFAPLSESVSSMPPPGRLESFASTSNQVEVDTPLTQTQANKVDALSRLLEVASKAPHKSPEDKRTPSDSASKIAAEINKPPGRVSRQVETIQPVDYNQQPGQGAAMSSPFGGSSPFSSPFNSPSSSQTGQASQSPLGSGSGSGMANPYDGVSGMPQATVSNDAVSARIAALNRKLEEQNRPPSASAVNIDAMAQIHQQAEAQAQSQQSHVGTGTSPSVNSLSQLPPQVDDSPSTRAELVNRILGSAKISQHGTKMPELPTRTVAETMTPEQTAAIRGGKGSSAPPRNRARVSRMPGVDLRPIIAIVVLLVVLVGGGFFAYQSGMIKFNLPDSKPGSEAKVSIDQMIKNGELDRARELLESKVNSGKITASEGEKLHSIYYQMANKVDDEDPSEAIKLLEKIPSRSKKYKDAQKLLRKLKKKVKKN